MKHSYYSNGKLLLSGEYAVLDGATALAIPTKFGQSLEVREGSQQGIVWKSYDENGAIWFETAFNSSELADISLDSASKDIKQTLVCILRTAQNLQPSFLSGNPSLEIHTKLTFPRKWGLGTSSTLINNIAQWAEVNAFELLQQSFGGSGYDIAAARIPTPFLYSNAETPPIIEPVVLPWDFREELFFVYLNQKQDSKEGISRYRNYFDGNSETLQAIGKISRDLVFCSSLLEFERLLQKHEQSVSEMIQLPTVKEQLFADYPFTLKSLGAWGGDFILATGNKEGRDYFNKKGYTTQLSFIEMIL
ncbi:GYDIA family GHMP kinase [Luteirhabdus pelagi]|uniref:GYDIA family GHMP kinase n=1 Tax=Luteirhabdus pelagi TaxID=2792783 RepID=UPI00193977F4|nr:GYDIA family GHMP kinase [Luteirhabdus pelagi]